MTEIVTPGSVHPNGVTAGVVGRAMAVPVPGRVLVFAKAGVGAVTVTVSRR